MTASERRSDRVSAVRVGSKLCLAHSVQGAGPETFVIWVGYACEFACAVPTRVFPHMGSLRAVSSNLLRQCCDARPTSNGKL